MPNYELVSLSFQMKAKRSVLVIFKIIKARALDSQVHPTETYTGLRGRNLFHKYWAPNQIKAQTRPTTPISRSFWPNRCGTMINGNTTKKVAPNALVITSFKVFIC